MTTLLNAGRNAYAFWFGSVLVTAGVALHVPMFAMGRHAGYVLAGMVMDQGMYWAQPTTGLGQQWCRLTMHRCSARIGAWPRCWRSH